MKRFFAAAGLVMLCAVHAPAASREADWQKVNQAIQQGLPKSALTNLEPILAATLREKAYPEAVKAIALRITLEGNIEGNKPEEKILRMEAEIAKAPGEIRPMLQTVLSHWYWHYFQQNRWRFMQRTATAQAPGKDFTTWDLPRLFDEIDRHFQAALKAAPTLKTVPVATWDALLAKGTMPDAQRPTLYDFVAHQALEFYTSGEQAGAKAQDAFELLATSPVLGSLNEFLAWKTPDSTAPEVRAIRLYQELLRFHEKDPAPRLALAAVELERLTWGHSAAAGEEKRGRYQAALEGFIRDQADFDLSALARERLARLHDQAGERVLAHKIASEGARLFPRSPGGKLCANLVAEIESKSASIRTERVWNAPWPMIRVEYRNVTNVYFRAISCEWETFLDRKHNRPEALSQKEKQELLARAPALEWSEPLAPTLDYKTRTTLLKAPQTLKPGFYFIAASHKPGFAIQDNQVTMTDVWVSTLALVLRQRDGHMEGFVLQAGSGEPVAGAQVAVWHLDNQGNRVADPGLTTDADGFFRMKPGGGRNHVFLARHNGQALASAGDLWAWDRPEPLPEGRTVFFTDRAIYRPGQIVQYKGICLWVDPAADNYTVLKGEKLTVVFQDSNGKEIARQEHRANDAGAFGGSFTAPRDRLMGAMALTVQNSRAHGSVHVQVEEYKRPKFEVTLDRPRTAPRLNDTVTLSGRAAAYTGAAVDGAAVRYRVVRRVEMPWWWGWWRRPAPQGEQEIAHGTLTTGADGSFAIEFPARPDRSVPEKDDPKFVFSVTADVTDTAGETRSDDVRVKVGYTALEASLSLPSSWAPAGQPLAFKVQASTLDGEPLVAEGSVKIHTLTAPATVPRAPLGGIDDDGDGTLDQDMTGIAQWPLGRVVEEKGFTTDTNGNATITVQLSAGAYRAVVETQDRFGKKVTGFLPVQVVDPAAAKFPIKVAQYLDAPKWSQLQPGQEFTATWGTGYDTGRAFIEIEHRDQIIQRFWTPAGRTQHAVKLALTEAHRGGFTIHVTQVRENRACLVSRRVEVPWTNKDLNLRWERFVSKLQPGQKETWSLVIQPAQQGTAAEKAAAELVATLYDASLDAFMPHQWPAGFGLFRQDHSTLHSTFANGVRLFQYVQGRWNPGAQPVAITYRSFPPDLVRNFMGYQFLRRYGMRAGGGGGAELEAMSSMVDRAAVPPGAMAAAPMVASARLEDLEMNRLAKSKGVPGEMGEQDKSPAKPGRPGASAAKPDLSKVAARKNLNETAFFFPHLAADSNGVVRMTFTMPEALTRWKFLGFAHDARVRSGLLTGEAVTAKDLMIQPNPPRFLREGDTVEFTVKVQNQSGAAQAGTAKLSFTELLTGAAADKALGLGKTEQPFSIPARESRTLSWRITVPDGAGFLAYKVVGATAALSDGEEGAIPVLSRRILVTESLPLPIRGPATRQFEFTKLIGSGSSKTLRHQNLTAQMVSNPAWYAVLALPYLMEYPHECSEQTFNRLYANALAQSIANSDPKIRAVFDQWRNTPALDSPLEKNQDLKSVMIEETPWLRQASKESQARRNVGVLFDDNRLNAETERLLQKLAELQLNDGAWPWFPGGLGNDYITLYITTGFGRLRHLGVDIPIDPAVRSLQRLDNWMRNHYDRIQEGQHPENYVPSSTDALYLYGRSFFLKDRPIDNAHRNAVEFFLGQARKFWLKTDNRQTQGHLALALKRFSPGAATDPAATAIVNSLRERSVSSEELGMFWRDTELSWWWFRAPIETQALMIEAFDEIARDAKTVEDLKVWLLKQKQTQDWKTTKATADAVYALLLRGRDILSSSALVELKLDNLDVTPKPGRSAKAPAPAAPVEAGTGFYEVRFDPADIKPGLGKITVRKTDPGVAWGSVHWQYLEDMTKVTPYTGTPLKLKKSLYVKSNTARGPVLEAVSGPVKVGDELVVRIELRVDRDMEYIHLKDQRGSGTEPVNVLSRYKYQDGLAYYESTRDTASHFFIDYLPKGVYVFEYSTRVQLRGEYQTGIAEIQCLYAPEFNAHSESIGLKVR